MGKSYLPDGQGAIFKNIIRFAGGTPLDGRVVVDTYNDIAGNNYKELFTHEGVESFYVGMLVVTKDTGKLYVLTEEVETSTELNEAGEEIIVSNTVTAFKEVTPDLTEIEGDIADALDKIADLEETDITGVTVNNVKAVVGDDKVANVEIEARNVKLGEAIKFDGKEVYGSGQTVSAVLQAIQDSVSVAVSGGLTGIVAGDGVSVSEVTSNKQTISAKVSEDEDNLIKIGSDGGLFAVMYYDGDDAE